MKALPLSKQKVFTIESVLLNIACLFLVAHLLITAMKYRMHPMLILRMEKIGSLKQNISVSKWGKKIYFEIGHNLFESLNLLTQGLIFMRQNSVVWMASDYLLSWSYVYSNENSSLYDWY